MKQQLIYAYQIEDNCVIVWSTGYHTTIEGALKQAIKDDPRANKDTPIINDVTLRTISIIDDSFPQDL